MSARRTHFGATRGLERLAVIGVNLLWCVPGQVGGSEEYLVRQLLGLHEAAPELVAAHGVRVFVLPGFAAAHPDLAERFELVAAPVDGRWRSHRAAVEATWLHGRLAGAAAVHHGGGTVPLRSPRPIALTVHDLQYRELPAYFSVVKRTYLRTVVPRSVRRADVVAVPSDFVRRSVVEAFGVDPERVRVVPHGLEPGIGTAATPEPELRRRLGLGDRKVLVYPAMTHPHKNHRFLIDLLCGPWRRRDVVLVFVGGPGVADDDVRRAAGRAGGRVVRPGRVSTADRDGLVAMADALVFPSEYEGFGAPVLEAMALGTPVIASDRTALPEVVGDAGLVLPLELDAWAGALDAVDGDRQQLVAAGHRRAAQFTAAAAGRALSAVYGSLLG